MKIVGIIAEYNPFHRGHLYHLEQTKAVTGADYVIAVISGNFVQRGGIALVNKWLRAEMAVKAGVDLVIELPTFYATDSAENFARGAVKLFDALGVDYLCFGAENADIKVLKQIAKKSQSNDYYERLKKALKTGIAYHSAVAEALDLVENEKFSFLSNNILALEYLKALDYWQSDIEPVVITRLGADYHSEELESGFASATAIRKQMLKKSVDWQLVSALLPTDSYQLLYDYPRYCQLDDFRYIFNAKAIALGSNGIAEIRGVSEGLENRLYKNLSNIMSLDDLVLEVSSKRYPQSRIRRIITNILLNIKKDNQSDFDYLDYARLLAYRTESKELLKYIKKHSSLFMINNLARDLKKYRRYNPLIELDIKATGIYATVDNSLELRADYLRHPFRLNPR